MANTIEQLVVDLRLNSAQLSQSLNQVNAQFSRAVGGWEKTLAGARKAFGALGLSIGAVSFARFVQNSITTADRMTKLSQAAGLNVRAFSSLAHAADLGGVNLEEFAANMGRLSQRMADAVRGNKELSQAFTRLGVDTRGKADEALLRIADTFAKMPDGVAKTSLAIEVFGRSGAAMIPVLNQGRAGIEALQREADRLGITVDEKFGKQAEAFNDNMRRLQLAARGLGNTIASSVLPQLEKFSARSAEIAGDPNVRKAFGFLLENAKPPALLDPLGQLSIGLKMVKGDAEQARQAVNELLGAEVFKPGRTPFDRFLPNIAGGFRKPGTGGAESGAKTAKPFDPLDLSDLIPKVRGVTAFESSFGLAQLSAQAPRLFAELELPKLSTELEDAAKSAFGLREAFIATFGTSVQQAAQQLQPLNDLLAAGIITQAEFARASEQISRSLGLIPQEASQVDQALEGMRLAFGQAFEDAALAARGFMDVLRQLALEIARIALRGALINPLFGKDGLFTKAIPSLFGLPSSPIIPKNALGGSVFAGQPSIVGERGPELFIPHSSGQIVPNGQLGGQIIINQDNRNADLGAGNRAYLGLLRAADAIANARIAQTRERALRTV